MTLLTDRLDRKAIQTVYQVFVKNLWIERSARSWTDSEKVRVAPPGIEGKFFHPPSQFRKAQPPRRRRTGAGRSDAAGCSETSLCVEKWVDRTEFAPSAATPSKLWDGGFSLPTGKYWELETGIRRPGGAFHNPASACPHSECRDARLGAGADTVRVLEVLPSISSRSGGPPRSTLANCRALVQVDPDVRITLAATSERLDRLWREEFVRRMPPGMNLELFSAVGRHTATFSVPLMAWLWKHAADYDLVIVRALLHPISSGAAWIARRRRVPYLVVPHGTLSGYTFRYRRTLLKRVYFRLVDRSTLAGAAAVRFTSESERKEAPPWGASTPTPVIPHPHEPRFDPQDPVGRNSGQILFLSRLDPVKGIDVLLQAVRELRTEHPEVRLILAGSGMEKFEHDVQMEVDRLDIRDAVELPGFVEGEGKARLLAESAVFVLPSQQENFGVAVVEAMDAGLPVVISRCVGIWREVEEAGAGIVVDRDPLALYDALASLLRNPKLRRGMGMKGRELSRTRFAPERIGRELLALYREVAGVGSQPRGKPG